MNLDKYDSIRAVIWQSGELRLLDQRILPHEHTYLSYTHAAPVAAAIKDMVVRGAPAIGVTAAYAVVLAARDAFRKSSGSWKTLVQADLKTLADSRPTAVNLFWALDRMKRVIDAVSGDPEATLEAEAKAIHAEDIAANKTMGRLGAALIEPNSNILTHCNTGSLATGGFGTALGVIRSAWSAGKLKAVYADETRPWLQGARLTAWELVQDNIPVTLIAEGAAAYMMQQGNVSWVIVGSDRIAANGDVANKIGTYGLAVLAKYHGLKFMVVAPSTTVDMAIRSGKEIPIEQRSPDEVLMLAGKRIAAQGASASNPAFDVTPAALIDAIVTEKGVVLQPDLAKMQGMMAASAMA